MIPCPLFFALAWLLSAAPEPESYLGIHTALPAFAETDALDDPDLQPGLSVIAVVENSPASQAGVEVGDRLLRVNGVAPRTPQHLEGMLSQLRVGSGVRLDLRRAGRILELSANTVLRLAPRPVPEAVRFVEGRRLGLSFTTPDASVSTREGTSPGAGVVVERILDGSPAAGSGLEVGDLILAVDGERVYGGEDLVKAARALKPGEDVVLFVSRRGRRLAVQSEAMDPASRLSRVYFPLLVSYENDPGEQAMTLGLILGLFKYTEKASQSTYRFFWLFSLTFGSNEELQEIPS